MTSPASPSIEPLHSVFESLPADLLPAADAPPEMLAGGRNNRVYEMLTPGRGRCILKIYNPASVDGATRLARETAFLHWLHAQAIDEAPRVLHANTEHNFAVLEFREGERLAPKRVDAGHVREAAELVLRANAHRAAEEARSIPRAAEGCFSLAQHAGVLSRRLDRLGEIETHDAPGKDAAAFVAEEVRPAGEAILAKIAGAPGAEIELEDAQRWLSPSDFGFHNALAAPGRPLVFLDFEHAGWDDPAKMIADFCNQPDFILPDDLAAVFRDAILGGDPRPELLGARLRLLTPLYQLKWSCILLNEFLPSGSDRREFLGRDEIESALPEKERQFARARLLLERAKDSIHQ